MKNLIHNLDKILESRVRLGIMSALMVNDELDFSTMKQALDITDGNLSSHISALESEGYLKVTKTFVGKKPQTTYTATTIGRRAFAQHLDALEKLIKLTQ